MTLSEYKTDLDFSFEPSISAETELRILKNCLHQFPIAIAITTGATHILQFANPAFLQIVECSEEILGQPIWRVVSKLAGQSFYDHCTHVYQTGSPLSVNTVSNPHSSNSALTDTCFQFVFQPQHDVEGNVESVLIYAADITEQIQTNHRIEQLEGVAGELQVTNEELQTTQEELETTIEEFDVLVEELRTANDELSLLNEELQSLTGELQQASDELNQSELSLQSILSSLPSGVVILDQDLHVQSWSAQAQELWGLWATEVEGQHFLNLDIGLPIEQLAKPIRTCLSGAVQSQDVTLAATNRRGQSIECEVTCVPLIHQRTEIVGAILLMQQKLFTGGKAA
ncbi:PAS domain-containing protein [Leptolyngbya sp. NIES-2104]|uniref:PAS domain-containing protein n=1 Tax=Leptolyngbya sp. NIES-2104 TaxID=1552121 RepID=UPI0006ECC0EC|nr:PAS domain-containing protein [Leptolyngbya sp. NIES-2104]GAP94127.1 chemotaxis protein methyltransferase CheR [Leptolyngbya sp. NIES-2104]